MVYQKIWWMIWISFKKCVKKEQIIKSLGRQQVNSGFPVESYSRGIYFSNKCYIMKKSGSSETSGAASSWESGGALSPGTTPPEAKPICIVKWTQIFLFWDHISLFIRKCNSHYWLMDWNSRCSWHERFYLNLFYT